MIETQVLTLRRFLIVCSCFLGSGGAYPALKKLQISALRASGSTGVYLGMSPKNLKAYGSVGVA